MFRKTLLSVALGTALFGLTACNDNHTESSTVAKPEQAIHYKDVIDRRGTPTQFRDFWLITSCRSANNIMPITFFLPAFIASSFYSA